MEGISLNVVGFTTNFSFFFQMLYQFPRQMRTLGFSMTPRVVSACILLGMRKLRFVLIISFHNTCISFWDFVMHLLKLIYVANLKLSQFSVYMPTTFWLGNNCYQ